MKILFLGDVVGKPGREALAKRLGQMKVELGIDACIANGENAAGGSGITRRTAEEMFAAGVDVITGGDHMWRRRETVDYMKENPPVVRPANASKFAPGLPSYLFETTGGILLGVTLVLGRVFMKPIDCPFAAVDREVEALRRHTPLILVDVHAEATAEKVAMGRYLDGRVSAVMGTHTHVQTADECILPGGTAYITDVGMVGPHDSVIGRNKQNAVAAFVTGMPYRFSVADGDVRICGAVVEVDEQTGRATSIRRVMRKVDDG